MRGIRTVAYFPNLNPTHRPCDGKSLVAGSTRRVSLPCPHYLLHTLCEQLHREISWTESTFTRSQRSGSEHAPARSCLILEFFKAGRIVRRHGFGLGTAGGAGIDGGAGALIGGFGLDILPAPLSVLFTPWFMVPGW